MAEQYSIVSIHHNFFIHSSIDGHLGCVYTLAVVNNAVNMMVHLSFQLLFLFSSRRNDPEAELLDRTAFLFLIF